MKKSKSIILLYLLFAVIIALSFLFAYLINKKYKKDVVGNAQKELLIRSEIIASGIEKIFIEHQQILKSLAKDTLIINALLQQQKHYLNYYCPISNVYEQHKDELNRISLFNAKGIRFHSHSSNKDSIIDLHKTKRISEALKNKELTISRIFKNTENEFAISMSKTVYFNNKLIGLINIEILTKSFGNLFAKLLHEANIDFIIVDDFNDIYSSNNNEFVGKNIDEIIEGQSNDSINKYFKGRNLFIKKRLQDKKATATFKNTSELGINGKIIAAFNEFYIVNKRFTITIIEKYDEVIKTARIFTVKILFLLTLVLVILAIIILLFFKNQRKHFKLQKETDYLREITKNTELIKKQKDENEALYEEHKTQNHNLVKAKQEIEESEERFKMLSNLSFEGILIHKNGIAIDMNDALEKMFGYSRDEIIGKHFVGMVVPDKYLEKVYSMKDNEYRGPYTIEGVKKDGSTIFLQIESRNIVYKGEKIRVASFKNISEQKMYEEEIVKYQQKLALHIEQTPFGVIDWNLDFTVDSWNKGAENIFGYTADEAIGKHGTELILKGKLKGEITDIWKKIAENRGGNHNINDNNTKTGEIITCEWYNTPLINSLGEVIGVASLVHDITEQKKYEQEIQKLNTAIEQSPATVVITDTEGNIEYVNPMFTKTTGYTEEEALGKTPRVLKSGEQTDHFYKELWDTVTKGKIWVGEFHNKRKDGSLYWESATISPVKNKTGNITNYLAIKEDITEKKKIEQAFKESEEKFKAAFKTSPDAINIIRTSDSKYIEINEGFTKLTGYTEQDVINKTTKEVNIWYNKQDREKILKKLKKNGFKNNFEAKIQKKDGTIVYALISARIFELNNKKYILFVSKDIQNIKDYEKELIIEKERAELSDKLKSAFLANMSHEIRTPMNGILGFSGLLSRADLSEDKRVQYTNIIQSNSEQLLTIINDILDISKIEAGQIEIYKSEFELSKLFNYLFISYKQQINSKNLEFYKKHNETQLFINTDESKLKQIITNLINNAIKFTHNGSIEIGYTVKSKHIEFFVKDTGIGITREQQKIIFDRFRQVELTSARKYGGTGLGLSISKAFLKKLGGKIWLESKIGKGSTFYFTIPLEKISKSKIIIKKEDVIKQTFNKYKGKTILIAEDEISNFYLLQEMFEENKANLVHVKNGKDAVEKCKTEKIDLVLMDIKMPIMDGYEATKQIKKTKPNIPVIAQTAHAMTDDKAKALKAGCNDYITKPIDEDRLKDILSKYL